MNNKGTGSTFKAIGRKVLEETLVPDISLKTQTFYAENLEKTCDIIQDREKQLILLDDLIKSRLNKIAARWLARAVAQFYFIAK